MAYQFFPGGVVGNAHKTGNGSIGGWKEQGLHEASSVQNLPLGTKREYEDGSVYRYVHFVSAVGPGKAVAQDVSVANVASIDGKFVDSAGSPKDDYAAGDTVVYIRDSTVFASDTDVENQYGGGYFGISDDQGEGYKNRIANNSAGDLSEVQGLIKFTLDEPLVAALDSQSSCWIVGSRFKNLAIAAANTDGPVVGIAMTDFAADEYGWILTRGVANVLADESAGTIAINSPAVVSDVVNGALTVFGQGVANSEENLAQLTTEAIVGEWLSAAANGEYAPCYIRIE